LQDRLSLLCELIESANRESSSEQANESPSDLELNLRDQVITGFCNELSIPVLFTADLETLTDDGSWKSVHRFRKTSTLILQICSRLLSLIDERLQDKVAQIMLSSCAAFIQVSKNRWSTEISKESAESIVNQLQRLQRFETAESMIVRYSKKVLEEHVKSYFNEQRVDDFGQKAKSRPGPAPGEVGYVDPGKYYEDQPWKVKKVDCVEILEYLVFSIKYPNIAPIQHLIVPPILTMIDDFDPVYKTRGITLLQHALLRNSTITDVRKTGLGDVFFEALRVCWTYQSHPLVLEAALPATVELISVIEIPQSETALAKYQTFVEEGIIRGMKMAIGGKVEVIRTRAILPQFSILIIRAMKGLMANTWPRIPAYRGHILKSAATAWKNVADDERREAENRRRVSDKDAKDRDALRCALKELVSNLCSICQSAIVADLKVLLEIDSQLFTPLLGTAAEDLRVL
ncbi:hypothetical protein HDU76_005832, partial [Blyttiomyces sp. JEL0837]